MRPTASITLNGEAIGEIGQFALLAGSRGVPSIFLSGDEAACRELAALVRRPLCVLERRFFTTASVEPYLGRPGIEIVDEFTIRVRSDDLGAIICT